MDPSDPLQASPRQLEDPRLPATVWMAGLGWLTPSRRAELLALLSSEERQRLRSWRQPGDRDHFLLGRGLLRQRLGEALGLEPARLHFRLGPQGKPALDERGAMQFNLAHSGALVLLALHPRRPVGVDVERQRPVPNWEAIARRHLPSGGCEALLALPPRSSQAAFCSSGAGWRRC